MIKLTDKRRDMLANFSLNIAVVSFGVAVFESNWLGVAPAIAGVVAFFQFTKEK